MKQLITTIIALLVSISTLSACGVYYYPGQDALRFSLVNSSLFHTSYFDPFVYSIHNFGPGYYDAQAAIKTGEIDPLCFDNSRFWSERHHGIPSLKDVYLAIYTNFSPINDKQSNNQFIQCLYENNDSIGLEYLRFAKGCESFNSANEDAWGRSLTRRANSQKQAIEIALKNAEKCPDEAIKLRYAFLAIRMAYYSEDFNTLKSCYKRV